MDRRVAFGVLVVLAACGERPALSPNASVLETPVTTTRDFASIEGVVETHEKRPAAGAVVAFVGAQGEPFAIMRADDQGRFHGTRPRDRFAITATSSRGAAAYVPPAKTERDASFRLELGAAGFRIEGSLAVMSGALPDETFVAAARQSPDEGDLFFAPTSSTGAFSLVVPPGTYVVRPNGGRLLARPAEARGEVGERTTVAIAAAERAPAPEPVVDWLRTRAMPIATTDPGTDTADLAKVAATLATARVIGVGEATHGTREYFRLKHRLLARLVTHHRLTLLAMEANFNDAERLDAWLQTGEGSVEDVMAAGLFRLWRTEEVRDVLLWMRAWNADKTHKTKLHVRGYDVQGARASITALRAFFEKVDPKNIDTLFGGLAPLDVAPNARGMVVLDEAASSQAREAIAKLAEWVTEHRATYVTRTSAERYALMLQHTRVLEQARVRFAAKTPSEQFAARDKAMAENVVWLADQIGKDERVLVWAHNGHIQLDATNLPAANMGMALREKLGTRYVAAGFVLGEGTYRAWEKPTEPVTADVTIGPVEAGWVAEAFARTGHPIFAVDVREPPVGVVRDWLFAPHVMHSCGWLVSEHERRGGVHELGRLFDVAIYVGKTSSARHLPRKP